MNALSAPAGARMPKWPFFLGDALLLVMALTLFQRGSGPIQMWEGLLMTVCVAVGAILAVVPFVMEYSASTQLEEAGRLVAAMDQITRVEKVGHQIAAATAGWQSLQSDTSQTVQSAREVLNAMTAESQAFQEFLVKANDAERQHLRLEVDKLRRSEGEWLQLSVRLLDQVHALHQGAVRSGQPRLVEQIGQFVRICRDLAQRVGLVPFVPEVGEPFDPQQHQPVEPLAEGLADARIGQVVATGIRFQGQNLRKPLVVVVASEPMGQDAADSVSVASGPALEAAAKPTAWEPAGPAGTDPDSVADTPLAEVGELADSPGPAPTPKSDPADFSPVEEPPEDPTAEEDDWKTISGDEPEDPSELRFDR